MDSCASCGVLKTLAPKLSPTVLEESAEGKLISILPLLSFVYAKKNIRRNCVQQNLYNMCLKFSVISRQVITIVILFLIFCSSQDTWLKSKDDHLAAFALLKRRGFIPSK